ARDAHSAYPSRVATVTSEPRHHGWRLDRYLAEQFPAWSRARLQELIRAGRVTVSGQPRLDPARRLAGGEAIAVELMARPAPALQPAAMPLRIVYEDDVLAVIDKPAGLVVHPGAGVQGPTLVEGLLGHFGRLAAGFAGGLPRPGIVHRLDRGTSGLLIVAKTDEAHHGLARQFQRREVEKYYLALAHGSFARHEGEIRAAIARDLRRRTRMTTRRAEGREARTAYSVLAEFAAAEPARRQRLAYLRLRLYTGRTHQIRVHLSSIGHPIVGDRVYGAPASPLERLFLHATELRLRHPLTGQPLAWRSPLPPELQAHLQALKRL
ncbi:MAG: RluA family pseudouridine synthase, partial [Terriglobales bacterium]